MEAFLFAMIGDECALACSACWMPCPIGFTRSLHHFPARTFLTMNVASLAAMAAFHLLGRFWATTRVERAGHF